MALVHIDYSDGRYTYQRVPNGWHGTVVDVPEETLTLWDAIFQAADVLEEQLALLDNEWHRKPENCAEHQPDGNGLCWWCKAPVEPAEHPSTEDVRAIQAAIEAPADVPGQLIEAEPSEEHP